MDLYKKTNLKFNKNLGFGRNLRAAEINASRVASRHTRYSMQRCFVNELEDSENQPTVKDDKAESKIPTFGKSSKPNLKAPMSREEMLQKWKEEKNMKRQQEIKLKKPTFKAGFVAQQPVPVFAAGNKNSFKTSSIQEPSLKPLFSSKIQASSTNKKLSKSKESYIQSSYLKPPVPGNSNSKIKNDSHIQQSHKVQTTLQKPLFSAKQIKKQDSHIQQSHKVQTTLQKPLFSAKQVKKQEDPIQAPVKSQIVPKKTSFTTTNVKSKLHPPAFPKPTESKILKKPEPMQSKAIQKRNQDKIPEPKAKQLQSSSRIGKGPTKPSTQLKQTGIPSKPRIESKQESKTKKKDLDPDASNITFRCEISHIEPVEEISFAPKDFLFNPSAELSFLFLEDGPQAIFSRLKKGPERTSTPKRAELKEIREEATENSCNVTVDNTETEGVSESPEIMDLFNSSPRETVILPEVGLSSLDEKKSPSIVTTTDGEQICNTVEDGVPVTMSEEEQKRDSLQGDILATSLNSLEMNRFHSDVKECSVVEDGPKNKVDEENTKLQDPIKNLPDVSLYVEEDPLSTVETTSGFSGEENTKDSLPDLFNFSPKREKLSTLQEEEYVTTDSPKNTQYLENSKILDSITNLPEAFVFEEKETLLMAGISITNIPGAPVFEEEPLIMAGTSSKSAKQETNVFEGEVGIITRRRSAGRNSETSIRSFRRSEMPPLESISESIENGSLQESPPKPSKMKKSVPVKDFTPRRSVRIAKFSELDTTENLFDVRPSLCGTPEKENVASGAGRTSNLTYDFDRLQLESTSQAMSTSQRRMSTRKGKVSLLYTPPQKGRVSSVRKSIKGDLMSFSPDV